MKIPVIELMEFNTIMSLVDYISKKTNEYSILNKKLKVVSAYSDIKNRYNVPALSVEIMYRKNRSIGFGNFYGDTEILLNGTEAKIVELDGTIFEYRIQFNVYSNTRGENYKWCSILDEVLKNGEQGIPINTYNDKGEIIQSSIGNISYDFSQDLKNNTLNPNIETYDYHTMYELKATALQKYKVVYDIMELGDIFGHIK